MEKWKSEEDARNEIKDLVSQYYHSYVYKKDDFKEGDRICYAARVFDDEEMINLTDAMLDFWLTAGRFTQRFEKQFGKWIGAKYVHLVNGGSSANLLAFSVLTAPELLERQIKPGDEIITVACGFPTTISPIILYGAIPVFIDVTIPEYNIDVSLLEEAYTQKTKAVMLAHTLGNPFDIKAVKDFCERKHLWLIEDNCDSLGSEYTIGDTTKYTGTWGDIGTSSFYPPHHITMGEGGCVYTNNILLNKLILSYRDWGRDCICPPGHDNFCGHRYDGKFGELPIGYDHKYVYSHFGYNLKATDMQAAIGCAQLEKLPYFVEKRKYNWNLLRKKLQVIDDLIILPEKNKNSEPSWFGFLITLRNNCTRTRTEVVQELEANNIQTRLLFGGEFNKTSLF